MPPISLSVFLGISLVATQRFGGREMNGEASIKCLAWRSPLLHFLAPLPISLSQSSGFLSLLTSMLLLFQLALLISFF